MKYSRYLPTIAAAVFGLVVAVQTASAQGRPGAGGTQPGGGGGRGTNIPSPNNPSTAPTPTPTPRPGQRQTPDFGEQTMQRPFFLSGKVLMEDGTPPPDIVTIERVCSGAHRAEAYTDSKGKFQFQIGENRGVMQDASVGSGDLDPFARGGSTMGRTMGGMSGSGLDQRISNCEIRAVLPGYRSDMVNLNGRRSLDNPDVGTIILHRLTNVEGTTISATSLAASKDARKAFDKGRDALKKQKWPDAQKQFEKAVELHPKYAEAWYELGVAHQRQNNIEQARKAFDESLAADPKFLKPYLPIAGMAIQDRKWQEAADITDRLLRLDPVDYPNALLMNAVANINLHNMDAAEKSAREAVRLDTEHRIPRVEYVLGFILASKQDYAGALPLMKSYVQRAPDAPDADGIRKQITQLEAATAAKAGTTPQP